MQVSCWKIDGCVTIDVIRKHECQCRLVSISRHYADRAQGPKSECCGQVELYRSGRKWAWCRPWRNWRKDKVCYCRSKLLIRPTNTQAIDIYALLLYILMRVGWKEQRSTRVCWHSRNVSEHWIRTRSTLLSVRASSPRSSRILLLATLGLAWSPPSLPTTRTANIPSTHSDTLIGKLIVCFSLSQL